MSNFPKYIALENFRIFKERQEIDFSPITILTGPNSSGKSTVIKSLLLLKENGIGKDLDFSGASHQLGSFEKVVNSANRTKEISVSLPVRFFELNTELELTLLYKGYGEQGIISSFSFGAKGKNPIFRLMDSGHESNLWSIRTDYPQLITLLVQLQTRLRSELDDEWTASNGETVSKGSERDLQISDVHWTENAAKKESVSLLGKSPKRKKELCEQLLMFDPSNAILDIVGEAGERLAESELYQLFNNIEHLEGLYQENFGIITDSIFSRLRVYFAYFMHQRDFPLGERFDNGDHVMMIIPPIEEHLKTKGLKIIGDDNASPLYQFIGLLQNGIENAVGSYSAFLHEDLYHLPSVRGETRRVYSDQDNSSSFTILLKEFAANYDQIVDGQIWYFLLWVLDEFQIGTEFRVIREQGVVSIPFVTLGNDSRNLADLGYGATQFIAIILKIALVAQKSVRSSGMYYYDKTILMIEEPEANLHPKLQSKLADMFIKASEFFKIQFIIETHSEYLIRRMQYLVAMGEAKPDEISLYYFHGSDQKDAGKAKRIEFRADGLLKQDFGPGFFDEATRLTLELLNSDSVN